MPPARRTPRIRSMRASPRETGLRRPNFRPSEPVAPGWTTPPPAVPRFSLFPGLDSLRVDPGEEADDDEDFYLEPPPPEPPSGPPPPPLDGPFGGLATLPALIAVVEDPANARYPEVQTLQRALPSMRQLAALVGQPRLKRKLVQLFVYLSQDDMTRKHDMTNVCLFGGPGTGKSTIAEGLAGAFVDMGLLPPTAHNVHERFLVGTRSNMIAKFQGQTAVLTQALIDRCVEEGKVLLLDEAYQFGSEDQRDNFSKEMLDTLTQNLTRHRGRLFVILAGYREEVQKCFLGQNPGLARRFSNAFELEKYGAADLREMLEGMVRRDYMILDSPETGSEAWFAAHRADFVFDGGDVEALLVKAKMAHASRVFCLPDPYKRRLTQGDLDAALADLLETRSTAAAPAVRMSQYAQAMYN